MAWNGSGGNMAPKKTEKRTPAIGKGLLAGIIVVLAVGGVVYFMTASTPAVKVVREQKQPEFIAEAPIVSLGNEEEVKINTAKRTVFDIIRKRGGRQNLTEEDKEEIRRIQEENLANRNLVAPSPTVQTPFKHNSDQVIAMAMTAGDNVPPLPGTDRMLDESFVQSLMDPIVFEEGDDERTRQIKATVADVRKEIAERIKQGMSVREVLEEHRREMNSYSELKREAWQIAKELVDSGDIETADEFVRRANEKLEAAGMAISRPLTEEEAHDRVRQRRQDRINKTQFNKGE